MITMITNLINLNPQRQAATVPANAVSESDIINSYDLIHNVSAQANYLPPEPLIPS